MSDPAPSIPLNGPQRRHFEVVLASLEDALLRVEQLASGTGTDARELTQVDHDVPPAFAVALGPSLAALRAQVSALARSMALEGRRPSTKRTIRAVLTSQIVHLEDSDARRLRGYGEVDPRVPALLDPALAALIGELRELLFALEHPERAAAARPRNR
jgi:hypothetical protein